MLSSHINDFIDYDDRIKHSVLSNQDCQIKIIQDYSLKHYRVSSSALYGQTSTLAGYMVSLVDITELIDTMAELTRACVC